MGHFKKRIEVRCNRNVSINPRKYKECGNTFRTSKPIHKKMYCKECKAHFVPRIYEQLVAMKFKYTVRHLR